MTPLYAVLTMIGIAIVIILAILHLKKRFSPKTPIVEKNNSNEIRKSTYSPSMLVNMSEESETMLLWDTAEVGEILIITFKGNHKQRAMAKAEVSEEDRRAIALSHIERYDRDDESHKGVVAQQWKKIAIKVRNNPGLLNGMDASYFAILQEVTTWSPFEKLRLKESVVADVPKRPGETLPTEFFERMFDVPKVMKATTTSIHLAKE